MSELFRIPESCPVCGHPTSLEGDFLFCRNRACPAKLMGSIQVWVKQLGLLHWGDALIEALTNPDNPKIESVADLYRLSVEDIATCCSGMKVAQKCYDILHENKEIALELLLASLNIPNFGLATATDVIQAGFNTVDKIVSMTYNDLLKVPNIGEKTAEQVIQGLILRLELIKDLEQVLNIKKPQSGGSLQGKSFCITGELSKPRKAVEKMILDAGGLAKSSVTKTLSYLVTNDSATTSGKMKKAQKYGVSVINEQDLYNLLDAN